MSAMALAWQQFRFERKIFWRNNIAAVSPTYPATSAARSVASPRVSPRTPLAVWSSEAAAIVRLLAPRVCSPRPAPLSARPSRDSATARAATSCVCIFGT